MKSRKIKKAKSRSMKGCAHTMGYFNCLVCWFRNFGKSAKVRRVKVKAKRSKR